MHIHTVKFLGSSSLLNQLPEPDLPEYAFAGRSNVGKSSLLNMLAGRKSIARISATPGKTITINHFKVNETFLFADLPGYGYARVSKKERNQWALLCREYLKKRINLLTVFTLIDSYIPPQESDIKFLRFMGEERIPFCIVFTKTDRSSKNELNMKINLYVERLSKEWDPIPKHFNTSCVNQLGKESLLKYIKKTNSIFTKKKLP